MPKLSANFVHSEFEAVSFKDPSTPGLSTAVRFFDGLGTKLHETARYSAYVA